MMNVLISITLYLLYIKTWLWDFPIYPHHSSMAQITYPSTVMKITSLKLQVRTESSPVLSQNLYPSHLYHPSLGKSLWVTILLTLPKAKRFWNARAGGAPPSHMSTPEARSSLVSGYTPSILGPKGIWQAVLPPTAAWWPLCPSSTSFSLRYHPLVASCRTGKHRVRVPVQSSESVKDSVGSQGYGRACLLPWLIRRRDHHCIADGQCNEEVKNIRELRWEVGQRVLLVPGSGQVPVTLAHFLQQLGVRCNVFLLGRK